MPTSALKWYGPRHRETAEIGWVSVDPKTVPPNQIADLPNEAARQLSQLYGYEITPADCRLVPTTYKEDDQ